MKDTDFLATELKEAHPLKTVAKIKDILARYGISVQEKFNISGVPHCYSLNVKVEGTTFSVNGKGLTQELALASGYGELMERLQLGLFGSAAHQKSGEDDGLVSDVLMPLEDVLRDESLIRFVDKIGLPMTLEELVRPLADSNAMVGMMRFYDLTANQTVYYPQRLIGMLYGSNGGAAGNTIEEAAVQAISEIVERSNQHRILQERIVTPQIPEQVLQQYEDLYSIISYLRDQGFKVVVRDCSLGMQFPVVCVTYVDMETGKYHSHFGANPKLRIAIERALTETFQGRNLTYFTKNDDFLFENSLQAVYSELRVGTADKIPEFFLSGSDSSYNSTMGFDGENNRILLRQLTQFFRERGYSVLIKDQSCLGFPTCRVLVPGLSEVFLQNIAKKNNIFRFASYASRTMKAPAEAGLEDYIGFIEHINEMKRLSDSDTKKSSFSEASKLSLSLDPREDQYLLAATFSYVYYAIGNRRELLHSLSSMLAHAPSEHRGALRCMKRYLSLQAHGYKKEQIVDILNFLHPEETVKEMFAGMAAGQNPFAPYVLHCDEKNCRLCKVQEHCWKKNMDKLRLLINGKHKELDHAVFAARMAEQASGIL